MWPLGHGLLVFHCVVSAALKGGDWREFFSRGRESGAHLLPSEWKEFFFSGKSPVELNPQHSAPKRSVLSTTVAL